MSNGTKEWLTASRRSFQELRRQTGLRLSTTMQEDGDEVELNRLRVEKSR